MLLETNINSGTFVLLELLSITPVIYARLVYNEYYRGK